MTDTYAFRQCNTLQMRLSLSLSDVFLVNADDAHEGKERERYRYDTAADVLLSVLTHGASLFYPF